MSHFNFVESFSIVVSPICQVYLNLSQCYVVESFPCCVVESCSFGFSNQCCFTFNKDGHSNMTCIMSSLFANFEMKNP